MKIQKRVSVFIVFTCTAFTYLGACARSKSTSSVMDTTVPRIFEGGLTVISMTNAQRAPIEPEWELPGDPMDRPARQPGDSIQEKYWEEVQERARQCMVRSEPECSIPEVPLPEVLYGFGEAFVHIFKRSEFRPGTQYSLTATANAFVAKAFRADVGSLEIKIQCEKNGSPVSAHGITKAKGDGKVEELVVTSFFPPMMAEQCSEGLRVTVHAAGGKIQMNDLTLQLSELND